MNVTEEDLHELGESLDARLSVLQVVVNYDMNLDNRDYSLGIENLYQRCLTDYSIGKQLLEEQESEETPLESSTTESGLILEEDDTSWMRLEYDKLGEKLTDTLETHQEHLEDVENRTGRERLEDAMANYETLAWSIPPSYDLSLDYVDIPPKERDQSEIIGEARIIK